MLAESFAELVDTTGTLFISTVCMLTMGEVAGFAEVANGFWALARVCPLANTKLAPKMLTRIVASAKIVKTEPVNCFRMKLQYSYRLKLDVCRRLPLWVTELRLCLRDLPLSIHKQRTYRHLQVVMKVRGAVVWPAYLIEEV